MKMHEEVLQRTYRYQEKNGIYYNKTNGKVYKWLTALMCVPFLYLMAMNIFYLFSVGVFCYFDGATSKAISTLSIVSVCTLSIIIGFIMSFKKFKISGLVAQLLPLPVLLVTFGYYLKEPVVFSFKASFYYRHFIPIVLHLIVLCIMLVIAVREMLIIKRDYKKVYQGLYEQYSTQNPDTVSEEGWEEFLKGING